MASAQNNLNRLQHSFSTALLALVIFSISFLLYIYAEWRLDRAYERRFNAYSLANELRQTSNDLTKMVRSYISTGNPYFRQYFFEIKDIRDGISPRPKRYTHIYWDLVQPGQPRPQEDGDPVNLLDQFKKARFTKSELDKLSLAKQISDSLSEREIRAIKIVDEINRAPHEQAAPLRESAFQLVFDEEYLQLKAQIMKPIDDFFVMVDVRTQQDIEQAAMHAQILRYIFVAVGFWLSFLLWQLNRYSRDVLGESVVTLYHYIRTLGDNMTRPLPDLPDAQQDTVYGWLIKAEEKLQQSEHKRQLAQQQLEQLANIDALTQLPNRRSLIIALQNLLTNPPPDLAIAYLDLDGFKPINDRHGHAMGDAVLVEVAKRLTRRHYLPDLPARMGGDEFVILLPNRPSQQACLDEMANLVSALREPIIIENKVLSVSASIGLAFYQAAQPVDADTLLNQADQAMYMVKHEGKNNVQVFMPDEHDTWHLGTHTRSKPDG